MSLITKPTIEPLTLSETKRHLNLEHDDDDTLVERLIVVARQHVETVTGCSIVRQEHRLYLDKFEEAFLPYGPAKSITQVIYIDANGSSQSLSTSVYELDDEKGQIILSYDQSWPDARAQRNAIYIDYFTGYFDNSVSPISLRDDLPEDLKHAMLLLIGDLFLSRETQVDIKLYKNMAFDYLVGPYRTYVQ